MKKKLKWLMSFFIYHIFGVKKKVFLYSFDNQYSDSPKYMAEKIHELHPEYRLYWMVLRDIEVPSYVQKVRHQTLKMIFHLSTSAVWISNNPTFDNWYKGKKQMYIQTWHGDRGFKKVYGSIEKNGIRNIAPVLSSDVMLVGSAYGEMVFKDAFKCEGEYWKYGLPRTDILYKDNTVLNNEIRKKYNIPPRNKIVMFAPTMRDDIDVKRLDNVLNIDLEKVCNILSHQTGCEWTCLMRAHPVMKGFFYSVEADNILDMSDYPDMMELLAISDLLITDYSSSAGDFILTDKMTILYMPDIEDYRNERGFYMEPENQGFLIAYDKEELYEKLKLINDRDLIIKTNQKCLDSYGAYEREDSTEKVVRRIFAEEKRWL